MRTTLNLDDQLLISAKHRALEENVSLARVVEAALRESLAKPRATSKPIQLVTASGSGVKPGVDLDHGRSLLDIMDDTA
jgi:K+-transporting ATPase c subunit